MAIKIELHTSIESLSREHWNRLCSDSPFLEWEWLYLLERSGSIAPATGWQPLHIAVWRGTELVAAAPLYAKSHSMGEFVFDFGWADVATRLGVPYYPKLVGMIPATPTGSYRFLIAPGEDMAEMTMLILSAIERFCSDYSLHSCAFNYVDPEWGQIVLEQGFLEWKHQIFVWHNPGYKDFDGYLNDFTKNQRRNVRRERQMMEQSGIKLRIVPGTDVPQSYFSLMYDFYERTNDQFGPWAAKYLNRDFFDGLYTSFRSRIFFGCAFGTEDEPDEPIALSMLLGKNGLLFGRYWGAARFVEHLHFNLCYYSPIEWAIANGFRSYDAGMGGAHKVRRGFQAVAVSSLHRFGDSRMQQLMGSHIGHINEAQLMENEALNAAPALKYERVEQ